MTSHRHRRGQHCERFCFAVNDVLEQLLWGWLPMLAWVLRDVDFGLLSKLGVLESSSICFLASFILLSCLLETVVGALVPLMHLQTLGCEVRADKADLQSGLHRSMLLLADDAASAVVLFFHGPTWSTVSGDVLLHFHSAFCCAETFASHYWSTF
jgi:hypothetical protein